MILPLLIRRSLRRHALSTAVTIISIALASGLWTSVWTLRQQSGKVFVQADGGFDAVLGARGSKLQLVLNSVFHLESSPGNMPWSDYEEINKNPLVELAVPMAVGDNYLGWRLVGTLTNRFSPFATGTLPALRVAPGGRLFKPHLREAVAGNFVARKLGIQVGNTFIPSHGSESAGSPHEETFLVVGVLEPSNTPADRVIWVPIAAIQNMDGHNPDSADQVSAVLIRFKPGATAAGFALDQRYNRLDNRLTLAWPIGSVVAMMFERLGWLDMVLQMVSWLVAVVAGGSVLASLHNSMHERRREIAVLRALGAHRVTVFSALILEALAIAGAGLLAGWFVYSGLMFWAAALMRSQVGVVLDPLAWSEAFVLVPLVMLLIGALAGLIPAIKAYRMPVAENLGPAL